VKAAHTKIIAFIIALLLPALFLWITVFSGSSVFNLLPFEIHEAINPGGASEGTFIVIFDVIVAILLIIPIYKIVKGLFNNK
jgi:asparagine N-glycosylation enzyme membrane subunit Stt3